MRCDIHGNRHHFERGGEWGMDDTSYHAMAVLECRELEFTPETTFIYRDTMPLLRTQATALPSDRQTWYTMQVWIWRHSSSITLPFLHSKSWIRDTVTTRLPIVKAKCISLPLLAPRPYPATRTPPKSYPFTDRFGEVHQLALACPSPPLHPPLSSHFPVAARPPLASYQKPAGEA